MSSPGNQGGYQPPAYLSVPKKLNLTDARDIQATELMSRSWSKVRPEDCNSLSAMSMHTNLQEIFVSHPASIQNHAGVDWSDPNLSSFDPYKQAESLEDNLEISNQMLKNELAVLMEENMFEVENNFPAFEKIQQKTERRYQEYLFGKYKMSNYWVGNSAQSISIPIHQE